MIREQRHGEKGLHVTAKIGRHVSDAQAAIGGAVVAVRADEMLQRFGVGVVPASMLVENHLAIERGMKLEGEQHIALRLRQVRSEGDGSSIAGQRLIQLSLRLINNTQVSPCLREIRLEGECALKCIGGFSEAAPCL